MRFAVIDEKTKKVVNVIEWDEKTDWKPPIGHYLVKTDIDDIGDLYDPEKQTFTKRKNLA